MPKKSSRPTVVPCVLALAAALAPIPAAAQIRPVLVSFSDSGMRVAQTTMAGMLDIRMRLPRKGPHVAHALVVQRLTSVLKYETYLAAVSAGKASDYKLMSAGGPAVTADSVDGPSVVTELRPGRYILYCAQRDADGKAHVAKGEAALLNVVLPFGFGIPVPPKPDAVVRLRDGGHASPETMRPGGRTLQLENRGSSDRRVFVGRLRDGRTIADVVAWDRARKGPAPFQYVVATSAISPNRTAYVASGFTPGNYFIASTGSRYGRGELADAAIRPLRILER